MQRLWERFQAQQRTQRRRLLRSRVPTGPPPPPGGPPRTFIPSPPVIIPTRPPSAPCSCPTCRPTAKTEKTEEIRPRQPIPDSIRFNYHKFIFTNQCPNENCILENYLKKAFRRYENPENSDNKLINFYGNNESSENYKCGKLNTLCVHTNLSKTFHQWILELAEERKCETGVWEKIDDYYIAQSKGQPNSGKSP